MKTGSWKRRGGEYSARRRTGLRGFETRQLVDDFRSIKLHCTAKGAEARSVRFVLSLHDSLCHSHASWNIPERSSYRVFSCDSLESQQRDSTRDQPEDRLKDSNISASEDLESMQALFPFNVRAILGERSISIQRYASPRLPRFPNRCSLIATDYLN